METGDSIHLQAARRTRREDLELCFSDGACRPSLALTQYTSVGFNPPSRTLEVENVDAKQHLLHCLLPPAAPSLRRPTGHHWKHIELSSNDWTSVLQEQDALRGHHLDVVFCIVCYVRST